MGFDLVLVGIDCWLVCFCQVDVLVWFFGLVVVNVGRVRYVVLMWIRVGYGFRFSLKWCVLYICGIRQQLVRVGMLLWQNWLVLIDLISICFIVLNFIWIQCWVQLLCLGCGMFQVLLKNCIICRLLSGWMLQVISWVSVCICVCFLVLLGSSVGFGNILLRYFRIVIDCCSMCLLCCRVGISFCGLSVVQVVVCCCLLLCIRCIGVIWCGRFFRFRLMCMWQVVLECQQLYSLMWFMCVL